MPTAQLVVRQARPDDRSAVIELCRSSLGWKDGDPNEAFFEWKHDLNPVGQSPAWVAEAPDGTLAGLRVFLRWRFRTADGSTREAVRAVDTATHPDWQGKGIFTTLTLGALPDLRASGVDFVFNTPNDKSRPGYLKMGWSTVGRVPVAVRVAGPGSLARLAGARAAAEMWSETTNVGRPVVELLADTDEATALLHRCRPGAVTATDRTVDFLRWRYSFEPLRYRAEPMGDRLADGIVIFRVRRRGAALEATVCDVIGRSATAARAAVGRILAGTGADYAIRTGDRSVIPAGFVPAPTLGPVLTWKPLCTLGVPPMSSLGFSLGDIELF